MKKLLSSLMLFLISIQGISIPPTPTQMLSQAGHPNPRAAARNITLAQSLMQFIAQNPNGRELSQNLNIPLPSPDVDAVMHTTLESYPALQTAIQAQLGVSVPIAQATATQLLTALRVYIAGLSATNATQLQQITTLGQERTQTTNQYAAQKRLLDAEIARLHRVSTIQFCFPASCAATANKYFTS